LSSKCHAINRYLHIHWQCSGGLRGALAPVEWTCAQALYEGKR
jgi:hypothetical protein